jgi:hypothetical protein
MGLREAGSELPDPDLEAAGAEVLGPVAAGWSSASPQAVRAASEQASARRWRRVRSEC